MAGLQRSAKSFRRQGSSGLVWDDKFSSGDPLNQTERNHQQADQKVGRHRELRPSQSTGSIHTSHAVKVESPPRDPPSPRVSSCGLCGIFGKPGTARQSNSRNKKRKS
ncbi:MAPK kinase substrate protein At1g80180-like [Rhodamnia argentea]|uniref:MAPK kinase substrate protein At1g80180-like n=1 Tax=Rhodamnia argentea TaxID=178133 RepID=A0A8B8MKJ2_9MYRT|nr:MAPK kinase substrate protein At1g80180-like [Rhodamnia argentea]